MFEFIENESKAYVLGMMASSKLKDGNLIIPIKKYGEILYRLVNIFGKIIQDENGYKIQNDSLKGHLFDSEGNKLFPILHNDELQWTFIRGVFDSEMGSLVWNKSNPQCSIVAPPEYLQSISQFCDIPCDIDYNANKMTFNGTNCIDFLGEIYPHNTLFKIEQKYNKYIDFLMRRSDQQLPKCLIRKVDENAVIPSKCKESDAGFDITIIKEAKKLLSKVTLYDTGIQIQVNHGLYAEVVPRSSLSKSGYMLANSIGIIDRRYNGNIYIALIKVDESAPDIVLPFKCCQLIFRDQVHVNIKEVNYDFKETSRGEGGFGSISIKI